MKLQIAEGNLAYSQTTCQRVFARFLGIGYLVAGGRRRPNKLRLAYATRAIFRGLVEKHLDRRFKRIGNPREKPSTGHILGVLDTRDICGVCTDLLGEPVLATIPAESHCICRDIR